MRNHLPFPENVFVLVGISGTPKEEQIARLEEIVSQQTAIRQRTFYRFFRDQKTVTEIAREDNVVPSCIRNRLSTVIIHLRWKRGYILNCDAPEA